MLAGTPTLQAVSTHSRPKAAGFIQNHTAPDVAVFQHTAARRRLGTIAGHNTLVFDVSTHSRPKAAGCAASCSLRFKPVSTHSRPKAAGIKGCVQTAQDGGFNTQPPEGGWHFTYCTKLHIVGFQHTAARRRLDQLRVHMGAAIGVSTHSRPKAAGHLKNRL